MLTLDRWIRDRARTTPARVAIDCAGAETTYAELDERSDRLAAGLLEAGLTPGDRVATLTGTSPQHVVVFFACAKAGLILMPLNIRALTRLRHLGVPIVLVALLAVVPQLPLDIPVIFSGPLDSPGTLGLLALCLLFAGVALTYDLLFGFTGLLSFGHALYFALGVYLTTIALTQWEWSLWQAVAVTAIAGILVPLLLGAISLRVGGIAFAMVTLAFAQAGQVLVQKNPDQLTGGEEGLGLNSDPLPDFFVGVLNAKYLYWLALGYAVVVFLVVRWAVSSSPGHVWQAIRENEKRVEVIGLRPFGFKLIAFVLASFLCTMGGIVWLLVLGTGASPQVTTANFTLTLLVMVVIGGAGTRYGALLGGFLYTLLDQRLGSLAGSSQVQDLPTIIRKPLSEPLFILGTLFILLVFFVPGGLAGLGRRLRMLRRSAGLEGTR